MSTAERIEKLVKGFLKVKKSTAAVTDQMDEKILTDMATAFEESK